MFESNSIMRAAARLGPRAGALYGGGPLELSRIDGFLDRTLVFARDVQRYLLSGRDDAMRPEMESALASYLSGVEQALGNTKNVASNALTLADVAFACELCLLSYDREMPYFERVLP